jgi:hypothetical protein
MAARVGPIHAYFTSFTDMGFTHNTRAPLIAEFRRLELRARWQGEDLSDELHRFRVAVANEFNFLFGTDLGDLDALQRLCVLVKIHPPPGNVEECQKVSISAMFVGSIMSNKLEGPKASVREHL